jgi:hypothetical protein
MLSKTAQEILDKLASQGADGVSVKTLFEQLSVSKEEFETACQELVDERRVFWTQHKSRSATFPIGTIKTAANSESAGKRVQYESRQDHLDDMSDDRLTGFIHELIDHLQSSESDVFTAGNQIKEIGRILKLLSERIDRLEKRRQP